jgi:lysophospholipase L1-like esterase
MKNPISRRQALQLGTLAGLGTTAARVGVVGALATQAATAQAAPGDDPTTPLGRLKIAIRDTRPAVRTYDPLVIRQGQQNVADPIGGPGSFVYPVPRGYSVNPNPSSLADIPQIWGYRRDTWQRQSASYINSVSGQYASWYVAVSRTHQAQTVGNNIPCGMHFIHTGQSFEVLFAGRDVFVTLIADGKYMTYEFVSRTSIGVPLSLFNTVTRFDFGARATRRISVYGGSTQGPCAIAIGPNDRIEPWVRDTEPSFFAMTDSYGSGRSFNWFMGGPFWEAASLLGIPHLDLSSIGGTGYSPNNTNNDTRLPGNTFVGRLADCVTGAPDLFLTAGGINDNNSFASPPLYSTGEAARLAFNAGVSNYYTQLRAALPRSVLVAMGPWAPQESIPPNPVTLTKLATIRAALQAVGGPWIFLDNLNGGWINSAGASAPATGRGWQTGTGKIGAPRGDGNADIYVSADGTHPTNAGNAYLGEVLANNLRAAIQAL